MPTARSIALDVLRRARLREGFASDLLDERLAETPLSGLDRRLALQFVLGMVRRKATLDALIAPHLTRPFSETHPDTLDLLRLGAFQLGLLNQIPAHAAVHETVELAPPMVKKFINAILRRVADAIGTDTVDFPGPLSLPVAPGRYRLLKQPAFYDPRNDFPAYFAAAFSWPLWLARRWFETHGPEETIRLGFWFNEPPLLALRVNATRTTRDEYLKSLDTLGIPAEAGWQPQSVRLLTGASVRELPGFEEGFFAVQDPTSMLVAEALKVEPGMTVLDLCAAPGGKTTHLAELMNNRGRIVACDIIPARLDTVAELGHRLGAGIVETVLIRDGTDAPMGPFDAALVDAPCSNTGVLGRRPEVRWRLEPQEFEHLIRLQTRLLIAAIQRVRPGGRIVYSTCSIEPDENRGLVQSVLKKIPGLKLETERLSIPGKPSDGGYFARLLKTEPNA